MSCHHSFTTLFSHAGASLGDYRCRAPKGELSHDEHVSVDSIAFIRRGVFEKRVGSRSTPITPGQVLFYAAGEVHRTNHPIDHGDDCTVIQLRPDASADLVRAVTGCEPEDVHAFASAPRATPSGLYLRQWRFLRRVARAPGTADPLGTHEELLALAGAALRLALAPKHPVGAQRRTTRAAHRDLAHDTALLLATGFDRPWTLDAIADVVHSSPYHLSRVFRREMGVPIHRFLTMLRLREAVSRLAQGADDLTVLALDLGFAGRGHLSDTFRKEFGAAPSRVRAELGAARRIHAQTSKPTGARAPIVCHGPP